MGEYTRRDIDRDSPDGSRTGASIRAFWRSNKTDNRELVAILVPAHTRPSGGLRLQKLFSRFQQPCSCYGLFSSQSRGHDKNNVGRIRLKDSIETGAQSVISSCAPALDLWPEQLQAHISGKRQHQ